MNHQTNEAPNCNGLITLLRFKQRLTANILFYQWSMINFIIDFV